MWFPSRNASASGAVSACRKVGNDLEKVQILVVAVILYFNIALKTKPKKKIELNLLTNHKTTHNI